MRVVPREMIGLFSFYEDKLQFDWKGKYIIGFIYN